MNKKYYFSDIIARQLCVITTVIIFREVYSPATFRTDRLLADAGPGNHHGRNHSKITNSTPVKDFGEQTGCGNFPAAEYFCPIALSAP